jgi:hypothetical protein
LCLSFQSSSTNPFSPISPLILSAQASQQMYRNLCHKNINFTKITKKINPVHNPSHRSLKIYFNIILPSIPRSIIRFRSFRSPK